MEIITSVKYDKSRHHLVSFLKDGVKPLIIQLMDPRVVRKAVFNKTHRETIEILMKHFWSTMLIGKSRATGQLVRVLLDDDMWSNIHLIVNGHKDRLILLVAGKGDEPVWMHIGFVGNASNFNEYMKMINITDIELYSNLTHLEED